MIEIGAPDQIARRYSEVNFGHVSGRRNPTRRASVSRRAIRSLWLEGPNGERAVALEQGERCRVHLDVEFLETVAHPAISVVFRNEVRHTIFLASTMTHGPLGRVRARATG